jgi:hypothetical protein
MEDQPSPQEFFVAGGGVAADHVLITWLIGTFPKRVTTNDVAANSDASIASERLPPEA